MSPNRRFIRIFSIVSLVFITLFPTYEFAFCDSSVEYARSVVEMAGESLESAYLSVLEAERSGGYVSELVWSLRVAVRDLSEAERALELGDYDGASLLAEKADEAAKQILMDASRMGSLAHIQRRIVLGYRLFLSFGGFLLILLFWFLGWMWFRDYYVRRLIRLRPEVPVDES